MTFRSVNPYNESVVGEYAADSPEVVDEKLARGMQEFQTWKRTSMEDRVALLTAVSEALEARKADCAAMMTNEMGKRYEASLAELEKCRWLIKFYSQNAAGFLAPEPVSTDYTKSYVSFMPLGPILCVMPWNFPFWQVFRFAVPALLAGNTVLLKHASNVQGCARLIAELFHAAGAPEGLFQNLAIPGDAVAGIIERPEVRGVSLTGSTRAGKAVAQAAGAAMKKCVLELGGSDPYIILADADMDRTVKACTTGRLMNAGQSCIGAKRFIVERPVAAEFLDRFREAFESVKMGDPFDEATGLAPLAGLSFRDDLHKQVMRSVDMGARCLTGGYVPDRPGAFYPPTILAGVAPGMPAYEEELFGPVAAVMVAEDADHAVELANDSPFGLGAAVFSRDTARAERLLREEVEAGCCFVNDFVRSDPRLPFGGVKESGYGRELSVFGIREFCNIKTIVVT